MKVLHVGEYVNGGVATYINELLEYQLADPTVEDVFLAISDYNSEMNFNIDEKKIFRYKYKRNIIYIFIALFTLNNIINKVKPDIIHLHSTFAGIMVRLLFFIKKKDSHIIYTPHGWSFIMDISKFKKRIFSIVEKILSNRTDKIINISQFEYDESMKYGLPEAKSVIVHSGVKISNRTKKIDLKLDSNKINLLFIGRFDYAKGLDILLELFKRNNIKDRELYIIGASVLKDTKVVIPKNVHELGWVNHNEIDDYIVNFDAIIVPSRWEGFGLVVLEAMRNKKAVLVSSRGALPELVIEGLNGFIFDINSSEDVLKCISKIRKDELEKMGIEGYKLFKSKYTSKNMNKSILSIYKQCHEN
ncbi:glycosyltransferase [Heyndrickxia coagulans]|nr:glycosyltransferase [Heyndrickxia coagulans]